MAGQETDVDTGETKKYIPKKKIINVPDVKMALSILKYESVEKSDEENKK
jgi:hypothetical protein